MYTFPVIAPTKYGVVCLLEAINSQAEIELQKCIREGNSWNECFSDNSQKSNPYSNLFQGKAFGLPNYLGTRSVGESIGNSLNYGQ